MSRKERPTVAVESHPQDPQPSAEHESDQLATGEVGLGPATIKDVAALAQVSTATVSRVLNNHVSVSPNAIRRVETAVRQLGYQRNRAAQALRSGQLRTITLAVANLGQPWYSALVGALERELMAHDYQTVVYDLRLGEAKLDDYLATLTKVATDGVILATATRRFDEGPLLGTLYRLSQNVPLVVIGQQVNEAPWATVSYADRIGARDAVRHLTESGCEAVAFLGEFPQSFYAEERFIGYREALAEANTAFNQRPELVWPIEQYTYAEGYRVTLERAGSSRPDAIFAVNDELAIGSIRALHELGLRVPEDVSVIGFGNSEVGEYLAPATLTTVDGSVDHVALGASTAVLQMIRGLPQPTPQVISRGLVRRQSTRSRPGQDGS